MERATDPKLVEDAERILRQYSSELSLESISIFREDGVFLYSSDPSIHQEEYEAQLFGVLLDFTYNFVVGVLLSIILHDNSHCLLLKPIYMGEWGEVEGWYLALGSCLELKCEELSRNLREHVERNVRHDISTMSTMDTEHNKLRLKLAFNFPKIIGKEFEKDEDTVLAIEGDYGVVIQRYDCQPLGVSIPTFKDFPPILQRLDDLDDFLQYKTWGIMEPDPRPLAGKKPTFVRSNRLLKILLAYSFVMMIAAFFAYPDSYLGVFLMFAMMDLFLLFFAFDSKSRGGKNEWICPCALYFLGFILVVFPISELVASGNTWWASYLGVLLFSTYFLVAGILFTVIRWERKGVLHNIESSEE